MLRLIRHPLAQAAVAALGMVASAAWAGPRCYAGLQTSFALSAAPAQLNFVIGCVDGRLNANGMNRGLETQLVMGPSTLQWRVGALAGGGTNVANLGGGFNFATQNWLISAGVQGNGLRGTLDHEFNGDTRVNFTGNTLTRKLPAAIAPPTATPPAPPPIVAPPPPPPRGTAPD